MVNATITSVRHTLATRTSAADLSAAMACGGRGGVAVAAGTTWDSSAGILAAAGA
ncbi:hypothetical protein [Sphaerisporangium corydalis]|uniref:Uncharacterized protein n=1 Tax=Sphaerisporangium corydalis TaxID=1441875 RepID=A0ABV9EJ64_9ACTN|nr:hypothetical protein [Sphaerisporangium corydalis]